MNDLTTNKKIIRFLLRLLQLLKDGFAYVLGAYIILVALYCYFFIYSQKKRMLI
jgi:hypothetical protein